MSLDSTQILIEQAINIDSTHLYLSDTIYTKVILMSPPSDDSIRSEILKNGLTILIALIAGVIALIQVKSNIVSSARIKWIEDLKLTISEMYESAISASLYWEIFQDATVQAKKDNYYLKYDSAHSKFYINANKIKMQLNIKEKEHKDLEDLVNKVETMLDSSNSPYPSQEELEVELKKIVIISRSIFKKEWDKAKRIFRI